MKLINLIEEDFVNYRKPGMFLGFPYCSGKCNSTHFGILCQTWQLKSERAIDIPIDEIIERYSKNSISKALICGGLEPFDSPLDLMDLCEAFRVHFKDDIVIYTGYNECEIRTTLNKLKPLNDILVKFGRYFPGDSPHLDRTLGVMLASNNQYAEWIC